MIHVIIFFWLQELPFQVEAEENQELIYFKAIESHQQSLLSVHSELQSAMENEEKEVVPFGARNVGRSSLMVRLESWQQHCDEVEEENM